MNEARRRQHLQRMVDHGDRWFDPVAGTLAPPPDEGAGDGDLLHYALALLELSDRSLQGRAESILRRVIAGRPRSGPVAGDDCPRAETEGAALLFIWLRHRRRLGEGLAEGVLAAASRAAACIREADAGAAGVFALLALAEASEDDGLLARGLAGLERLGGEVGRPAGDPCRAGERLAGLHAITTYVRAARARELAGRQAARLWGEVAARVSPETATGLLAVLIERAGGAAPSGVGAGLGGDLAALPACVVNVDAPADARSVLAEGPGAGAPA